ncbi:unnamed protein product [Urochloa decumbens]|uniref:O-methyltransferase C-terminal domain-containing protein n=1 Tax=Urochloa decumbens TaxID=240449 RepID=A0ABC9ELR2_9POAL
MNDAMGSTNTHARSDHRNTSSLTLPLELLRSNIQNRSMAPTSSSELLQAQAELWCHTFAYLKSMALQSVITLGIPTSRDLEFGKLFNEAMSADSRFAAEIVVRECGEVFAGLTSLVDVGGGDGTTAKAIAKAFPHVRCSVLELPQVADTMPEDSTVEFVAGDMMEFVPPADAVLLKFVLHNWNDEDCVGILKRSKGAVSTREPKGKVIIIDTVAGLASKQTFEAQLLMDTCMMILTKGEERDEETWHRLFLNAGFSGYKISPILGCRSLIELYP